MGRGVCGCVARMCVVFVQPNTYSPHPHPHPPTHTHTRTHTHTHSLSLSLSLSLTHCRHTHRHVVVGTADGRVHLYNQRRLAHVVSFDIAKRGAVVGVSCLGADLIALLRLPDGSVWVWFVCGAGCWAGWMCACACVSCSACVCRVQTRTFIFACSSLPPPKHFVAPLWLQANGSCTSGVRHQNQPQPAAHCGVCMCVCV